METTEMHTGLCRICIQNDGTVLLDDLLDCLSIFDVIQVVFGTTISNNMDSSESICGKCFDLVTASYELKQQISRAEELWQEFYELRTNKEEEELENEVIFELKVERIDSSLGKFNSFDFDEEQSASDGDSSYLELIESNIAGETEIKLGNNQIHQCNTCDKICKTANDLCKHRQVHQTRRQICDICNKSFTSKLYLKIHQKTHIPDAERMINCEMCDKTFRTKTAYRMHLKQHNGIKDVPCTLCKKLFYHRRDLRRHMKTLHLEIKNYSCKVCHKKFSNSGNLYTHMRVHTGEKPYECKYCELKFNQSSSLNKHMEKHILKGDLVKDGP